MAADGSVYGIVAPHGTEGPKVCRLERRGIPYRQSAALGTSILTSGLGGVFPRGIPLGSVVDSAAAEEGWERTYLVRPAVHPSAVSHVMILTGGRSGTAGALRAVFERGEQGPRGGATATASFPSSEDCCASSAPCARGSVAPGCRATSRCSRRRL